MAAASARRRSDERHERQQGSARSSDETADGPAGAYVAAGDSALAAGAVPTPIRRLAGDWIVDLHTCEIVVKTQRPWECHRIHPTKTWCTIEGSRDGKHTSSECHYYRIGDIAASTCRYTLPVQMQGR